VLKVCLEFSMNETGMNAADVAAAIGVSEATVSRWRTDDHAVEVRKIMRSRKLWPHFLLHLYHRETAGGHLG
jgi:predicted transcriptional regulator